MPSQSSASLTTLIQELSAAGVEFVLVGGLAAVAQGAPITTFDVDIVHSRTAENLDRLLAFLASVHARHRGRHADHPMAPSREALSGAGHSLFSTDLGPLDCLGAIEEGRTFDDLAPESVELQVGAARVKVLALEALIRFKRQSAELKDKLRLPILEEALKRTRRPREG